MWVKDLEPMHMERARKEEAYRDIRTQSGHGKWEMSKLKAF